MDDLDLLMASLNDPTPSPSQRSAAPSQQSQRPVSYAPSQQSQRPTTATTAADDDLDFLMASLGAAPAAPVQQQSRQTAQAAPPQQQRQTASQAPPRSGGGGGGGGDELDLLMASLGGSSISTPPPSSQPSYGGASQSRPGAGASASSAARPPAGRPAPSNDIDDLIGAIGSQMKDVSGTSSKGVCGWCKQPILGEKMEAMGRIYHPDHFVCVSCTEPIGTGMFYDVDQQPNCARCYNNQFCPKCAHCDRAIEGQCIAALGKKWHPDHFVCSTCLRPFGAGQFFEKDGMPYCETHFYGSFCPTCAACDQPIRGDCINALGQQWHLEHFVCTYCHAAFGGNPYFEHSGKPYCKLHYNMTAGSVCAGCNKSIEGRAVQALGKRFHPEHFTCAFCMNPLAGANFTENAGKAYCKTCHGKLFA